MLTKDDFSTLGELIDNKLDTKLKPIHDDIKIIKKDVRKLKNDVSGVIEMADKGLLKVQTRVKIIERYLKFPEQDFA